MPALYHGHLAHVDFARLRLPPPVYINIVRDPLQRLVSYYYFLRYGDDKRPHLVRSRMGDTRTFDECVAEQGKDCHPNKLWLQVPFFCGHAAACWQPGSEWALARAKANLVAHYLLVGTTDTLHDFVAVLEATLPRMFSGATERYMSGGRRSHVRRTVKKVPPSAATVALLKASRVWQLEDEFYAFARRQFEFTRARLMTNEGAGGKEGMDQASVRPTEFFYDLIRPALRGEEQ